MTLIHCKPLYTREMAIIFSLSVESREKRPQSVVKARDLVI